MQCADTPPDLEAVTMEEVTYIPASDDAVLAGDELDTQKRELRIKKRGASMAIEEIARGLGGAGGGVFQALPALLARIRDPLTAAFGAATDGSALTFEASKMQVRTAPDSSQLLSRCCQLFSVSVSYHQFPSVTDGFALSFGMRRLPAWWALGVTVHN